MVYFLQVVERHCGEAVWVDESEGEKGCIYVMGNFDNSLYKSLQGSHRLVNLMCVHWACGGTEPLLLSHVQDCRSISGHGTHTKWMGESLSSLSLSLSLNHTHTL